MRSRAHAAICSIFLLFLAVTFAACRQNMCHMTADGSVWVMVVQLSQAEEEFHELHGRYGELVEMTNLLAGPAPDVMAGRVGSYTITIKLRNNGYILAANPEFDQSGHSLAAFYGDQTGIITYNSSGEPAGRHDEEFLDMSVLPKAVRDMAR